MDWFVFVVAGAATLFGGLGVVLSRNPVHAALMLVLTLFAVAVLFVAQEAHFLAAVQVIVYAGAIVVLFLFVIMLLGVDRTEDIRKEPLVAQRPLAFVVMMLVLLEVLLLARTTWVTGVPSIVGPASGPGSNIEKLAYALFTRYLLAFEVTSVLLVIAVMGAVVLARRTPASGLRSGQEYESNVRPEVRPEVAVRPEAAVWPEAAVRPEAEPEAASP